MSDSDECTKQAILLYEEDRRSRKEWCPKDSIGASESKMELSFQLRICVCVCPCISVTESGLQLMWSTNHNL